MRPHLVICGTSARAAAESAARAGFGVTAIDAFGDLDQHPGVRAISIVRDLGLRPTAAAIARAAGTIPCDAVVYLSPFENHPRVVATLASGRALWGNAPAVLRRVRDPVAVAAALQAGGFDVPAVRLRDDWNHEGFRRRRRAISTDANEPNDANDRSAANGLHDSDDPEGSFWLVKPLRSGGGRRIRAWRGGTVPRGCYLQERVEGVPGSVVFVAARGHAVPLAVSRQLVGDSSFGASGVRYCGSIIAAPDDPQWPHGRALIARAGRLAEGAASAFALAGAAGIDFIARGGVPWPIEINPRWTASMELIERAAGLSVFGVHRDACTRHVLPAVALAGQPDSQAVGKAIVFARRASAVGDTRRWLADPDVRDVPPPGQCFRRGQPVCTVFATGADAASCYRALVARAAAIYRLLDARPENPLGRLSDGEPAAHS